MSDELERRLRAAYDHLPVPGDDETAAVRRAVVAAAPTPRVRRPRRELALAFAALALGGAAFGGGYAVASGSDAPAKPAPRAQLNAGPGFLPAEGWETVVFGGTPGLPNEPAAAASTIPVSPADRALHGPPATTVGRLGPNGVVLYATFSPAGAWKGARERLLPLQLRHAESIGDFEGVPPEGSTRRLIARVGRYDVDVLVFFGAERPSAAVVAAAAQQLGRLVVPACPAALPLTSSDLPAAEAFVLAWLQTHYQEDAADLIGARATGSLGAQMPRGGAARTACGAQVFRRTVEVDVVLPRLEALGASLSQLSYFVSRTPEGWVVWQRIH
jgi:hypothetical protein